MVYTDPDTPYIRLLKPFLEKKKRLGLDKWGRDDTHVEQIYQPLLQHLEEEIPQEFIKKRYPQHWGLKGHLGNAVRELLFSEFLVWEYASYFKGKSFEELDDLAASFKLSNCIRRDGLNAILETEASQETY